MGAGILRSTEVFGQVPNNSTPPNQHSVSVLYHHGIVIPHHANMIYFIDDFSRGVEVNYALLRFDKSGWQQWYNFPEVGIGFFYNSYGNPHIYGQGLTLYPYLHFPIVRTPRFSLKNKLALGLGYTNRPFDYQHNPENQIFGTYLNAYVGLGLYSSYRVLKDWSVSASASLNHMSNGASRKPNNGINTFTLSLGASYHFEPHLSPRLSRKVALPSNRRDVEVFMNYGRSQAADYNFNLYSSGSLSIHHIWHRSVKSAWGAGLDMIYFGAAPFVYQEFNHQDTGAQRLFYGVSGGKQWIMGSTTAFVYVGAYLYSQIDTPQAFYPRVGLRQSITSNFVANFSIKGSFFRAEFLEFGLGYRFNYKKNVL
ncbi:acyloxyacyl hydrolase [Saccharicrinis carchari]|nr:acyloxyacyl hydrolase [Saccharicrinis carchari]